MTTHSSSFQKVISVLTGMITGGCLGSIALFLFGLVTGGLISIGFGFAGILYYPLIGLILGGIVGALVALSLAESVTRDSAAIPDPTRSSDNDIAGNTDGTNSP